MEKNNRVAWIDGLKGFLILTVVLLHCDGQANSIYTSFLVWCTSFHMVLFFFLSGVWFRSNPIGFDEYIIKKIKTLLVPYLIYGVIIGIPFEVARRRIQGLDLGIRQLILDVALGCTTFSPTWFLLSLFIIYIIVYFVAKINNKLIRAFFYIGIYILGIMLPVSFNSYYRIKSTLIGLFYFGCGAEIYHIILSKRKKIDLIISGIMIMSGVISCFNNTRVSLSQAQLGNTLFFIISSWSTIVGLCLLFRYLWESSTKLWRRLKSLLEYFGKNSIIVLCTHPFFILSGRVVEKIVYGSVHRMDVGILFLYTATFCYIFISFANKYLFLSFGKGFELLGRRDYENK